MTRRDPASEAQVLAADPGASTWLSANAGSGKTSVLIDRVARLLLDGAPPERILCLTYTKAAAGEMQNRLFKRLGAWAMLPDEALRAALDSLGLARAANTAQMRRQARTLFARALETPGGLKIQTIHSFCASLLRRFPLEAGVSPLFAEMDERASRRLAEDVLDTMAGGEEREAFDAVARALTGTEAAMQGLIAEILTRRAELSGAVDEAAIWARFDLPAGFGDAELLGRVFTGAEAAFGPPLLRALAGGSPKDTKAAEKLAPVDFTQPKMSDLAVLEGTMLTQSGKAPFTAKSGKFPTKDTRARLAEHLEALDALMERVEAARPLHLGLIAARRTLALSCFATAFLPRFEAAKQSRGWLDFDDLIHGARRLLTTPSVAQWVLYRLDGGIDHILVDEAQDTSPAQWDVIALLAREFTTGRGAREDLRRTIFVVGDPKQSIYSFQGADPDAFAAMRETFSAALGQVGERLHARALEYSFRSAEPILALVDQTFRGEAAKGIEAELRHRTFYTEKPGRVDLWPPVEKSKAGEAQPWTDPTDKLAQAHHSVVLAQRIAGEIARLIGTPLPGEGRPVRAGDFLVLVPRRAALFNEVIRACKAHDLPIAGADRLKVAGELAVRDLRALLAFLATPEDDLSLAEALKSPLFGISEADLYTLAAGRRKGAFLWASVRESGTLDPKIFATLSALLGNADFLRPFELIERILTRHHGRERLLARLGAEAEDGIDALLSQALAFERAEVPSLTGFLGWLDSGEVEIKRQLDSAGDRIRVMSVHGAKGLQSPIVILPDTGKRQNNFRGQVLDVAGGPVWKPASAECPDSVLAALRHATDRQEEERRRLLYVAMTRAQNWLIVCGAGDVGEGMQSWYGLLKQGLRAAGAVAADLPGGEGLSLSSGDWSGGAPCVESLVGAPPQPFADLPDWARAQAAPPERPVEPLSPSALGGAKVMSGESAPELEDAAKRRGRQVHLLLEHLPDTPPSGWRELARRLLASGPDPAGEAFDALLAEVESVLRAPELAWLFTPDALAEVEIVAPSPALGKPVRGFIDRLIITPGRIVAVDFKTNRLVPARPEEVPLGLLRQMGAYGEALTQIYPGREVQAALLWTRTATLMPLPHELVNDALLSTPAS